MREGADGARLGYRINQQEPEVSGINSSTETPKGFAGNRADAWREKDFPVEVLTVGEVSTPTEAT